VKLGDVEKRLEMAWRYRVGDGTHEPITLHLLGPGGVGKSTLTKTWSRKKAAELGLIWVDYDTLDAESAERIAQPGEREKHYVYADVRVTQLDPVDLMGLPRQVGSRARFLPLDLATLFERGHGLLVLDEFSDEERPNMQVALKKSGKGLQVRGNSPLTPHTHSGHKQHCRNISHSPPTTQTTQGQIRLRRGGPTHREGVDPIYG